MKKKSHQGIRGRAWTGRVCPHQGPSCHPHPWGTGLSLSLWKGTRRAGGRVKGSRKAERLIMTEGIYSCVFPFLPALRVSGACTRQHKWEQEEASVCQGCDKLCRGAGGSCPSELGLHDAPTSLAAGVPCQSVGASAEKPICSLIPQYFQGSVGNDMSRPEGGLRGAQLSPVPQDEGLAGCRLRQLVTLLWRAECTSQDPYIRVVRGCLLKGRCPGLTPGGGRFKSLWRQV